MTSCKRRREEVDGVIEDLSQRDIKVLKTDAAVQAAIETNSDTSYVSAAAAVFSESEEEDDTPRSSQPESDSELSTSSEEPSSEEESEDSQNEDVGSSAEVVAAEEETDEIINIRPGSKPNITREGQDVGLKNKLKNFLSEMQQADEELNIERQAGTLDKRNIEACEEGEPHVEMNLGLGVLEEKVEGGSSDNDSMSDESENNHPRDVMQKLKGQRSKSQRAKIQELSDG
jgi:hypothetical protein